MATNFLWYPGQTPNNGQLIPATTLITTEVAALASLGICVSTIAGSSGLFNSSSSYTAQGIWGEMFLSLGSPGMSTTAAGANFAGWFLTSPDNGTTFEYYSTSLATAPARSPDFMIPLPSTTISTNPIPTFKTSGLVMVPALPFKVLLQNNTGVTVGGSSSVAPSLKLSPIAMQY